MKYLGVDFGLRRIGLAQSFGELASPYKMLEVNNFKEAVEKVSKIATLEKFDKVIVGLPEGKMGKTVTGFIKALKKHGLEVIETEETLSSKRALQQMIDLNTSKKKRKNNDEIAATIILQDYLDTL